MNKEILKYLAGRFIPAIVNIAVIILAIRFLGPVEYGRYSLLLYTALLAITLCFHWVQVSIIRFLCSMPVESSLVTTRFFDLTILSAIFSTLIVVMMGLFYFHLGLFELVLVALFTLLNHFYLFHQAILEAYHRTVRTAILEGADQLLVMIVLLAGLLIFHWRSSFLLFGSLVIGFAGMLVLRSLIRVKGLLSIDLTHLYLDRRFTGKVIEFGYGIALWLFFSHLLMAIDRFIIMEYYGYQESGMYSALKDLLYKGVTFASLPIYLAYQAKIVNQWNLKHKQEAWAMVKEALGYEMMIFIVFFVIFMVGKQMLFEDLLYIPGVDLWLIYLPVLVSAFLWQVALLIQRFIELTFRYSYMLIAIGLCVAVNIALNLVFVHRYGMVASSLILLLTSMLYAGFMTVLALIAGRRSAHTG